MTKTNKILTILILCTMTSAVLAAFTASEIDDVVATITGPLPDGYDWTVSNTYVTYGDDYQDFQLEVKHEVQGYAFTKYFYPTNPGSGQAEIFTTTANFATDPNSILTVTAKLYGKTAMGGYVFISSKTVIIPKE